MEFGNSGRIRVRRLCMDDYLERGIGKLVAGRGAVGIDKTVKDDRRRERTNRFPTIPVAHPEDRCLKWPRRLGISWARVGVEQVLGKQVSLGRGPAIYWICVDELAGGKLGKCEAQIVRHGTCRIRRCCSRGAVATSGLALLWGYRRRQLQNTKPQSKVSLLVTLGGKDDEDVSD